MEKSLKGLLKTITVSDDMITFSKNNGKIISAIPFSQVSNFIFIKGTTFKYGYFTVCTIDGKGYGVDHGKSASDKNSITFNSSDNNQFELLYEQLRGMIEPKSFEDLMPNTEHYASDSSVESVQGNSIATDQAIKICLNCGDKLLSGAKNCPTCGAKAKDFPLVDKNDKQRITEIISEVPHPKDGLTPKWEQNLIVREKVWANANAPTKRETIKARIQENKINGVACCPKCGSTSISANKKGFGVGKAIVGANITSLIPGAGILGAAAGNIGAKKVIITCLNCGHQWKP